MQCTTVMQHVALYVLYSGDGDCALSISHARFRTMRCSMQSTRGWGITVIALLAILLGGGWNSIPTLLEGKLLTLLSKHCAGSPQDRGRHPS